MDMGSLFLILALLVLVVLFIARPFFETKSQNIGAQPATAEELERSSLMAEHDRLLNALQELDFDYTLGKIPEADYPAQRAQLLTHGADVLRRLDAFQENPVDEDAEARIEAVIAARRADARRPVAVGAGGLPGAAAPDDELEQVISGRRRQRQEKAAGFCPKCGGPVQKSDRFCPKCGTTLAS